MIVVDATVLGDLLVGEAVLKRSAEKLIQEDPDWVSVSLWRYELGNILWKTVRSGWLALADASVMIESSEALLSETTENIDRQAILNIAEQDDLTFYDASYVWLARSRKLKLRTRDRKILTRCPDIAQPMLLANEIPRSRETN